MYRLTGLLLTVIGLLWLHQPAYGLTIKLATVAPEGSEWMRSMRESAKTIKERTEGRVEIKLFGGGVMGNDASMLRKMRIGQIHGGAFVSGALTAVYPDLYVYGLPLLFRDLDEVEYVRQKMDKKLMDELERRGFVSFGFAGAGFAKFMSSTPVRKLEDIEGQKVWVPDGDKVSYASMESLGLSPVTLPMTDVLTGLQTGLLDIIASSPAGAVVFQWHTKVKYVTSTPLVYVVALMAVDKRVFNRISPEDQKIVREIMEDLYREFDQQSIKDNQSAFNALLANGIEQVSPAQADEEAWRDVTQGLMDQMAEQGLYNAETLEEVRRHLSDYRSQTLQGRSATDANTTQ